MSARVLLVMDNLEVVEVSFEGIREVLCESGYAAGVHGDRVDVDGESAGGDANLASVDGTNTERKFDWIHEIDLFSTMYEWALSC